METLLTDEIIEATEISIPLHDLACYDADQMFCRQEMINHGLATGRLSLDEAISLQYWLRRVG